MFKKFLFQNLMIKMIRKMMQTLISLIIGLQLIYIISMLTIYWNLASQPARAVKALVDLGKIQAEFIHLDLLKGQTQQPQFKSKNPFGKVPYLTHGDYGLGESNAILTYLCETFPEKLGKYYGSTPQQRGIVNQYLSWYQGSFRPGLLRIISLKFAKLRRGDKLLKFQLQSAHKLLKDTLTQLQQILTKNSPFITGANLTIADLLVFHELTNVLVFQIPFEEYKAVTAYFHKILEVQEIRAIYTQWENVKPKLTTFLSTVKADDDDQ